MPAAPALPKPVRATPSDPPEHHVRATLDKRLRALTAHEPGTRDGVDIEDLHQMRVAVRRMRAALKSAGPLLDADWADELRAELGWLGGALGPVRDLDVMLERLRAEVADLPPAERDAGQVLVAALTGERERARAEMIAALDAPRYVALLKRLTTAVARPLPTATRKGKAARNGAGQTSLVELVRVQARSLRRAVAKAGAEPPDQVLHDLRIKGKRLRYTGELAAPGLRGALADDVRGLLDASAGLQEVLGDHQDACVAEQRIRDLADGLDGADGRVLFVAGRLVEREQQRALRMREQWPAAWDRVAGRIDRLDR